MKEETLLHRQIHPTFILGKIISAQVFEISSQVFTPTPKDDFKLSVYNGEKFTPKESYEHYTKELVSAGTASVTIRECKSQVLNVTEDNDPFDGHSYIDYTGLSNGEIKAKAKKLKAIAITRGLTYIPEEY
ncbi:hypothetical protein CO230_08280 [Chryseobacterium sp. 6424]|uniref:hypothetical protein n=1 Tax=Chryseobacterium sp. 6424 TaxID=2039166 RepID=UPI000EFB53B7|nr:hypothetical protein [Chryseobacterium sp. 6424]AYO58117.1 hypothetical protein CO230_08280 [Chryseobacterium sp. 6424]